MLFGETSGDKGSGQILLNFIQFFLFGITFQTTKSWRDKVIGSTIFLSLEFINDFW